MKQELIIALLNSIGRIGLEATAIVLERITKPNATIDDAIAACRAAAARTLDDIVKEVSST